MKKSHLREKLVYVLVEIVYFLIVINFKTLKYQIVFQLLGNMHSTIVTAWKMLLLGKTLQVLDNMHSPNATVWEMFTIKEMFLQKWIIIGKATGYITRQQWKSLVIIQKAMKHGKMLLSTECGNIMKHHHGIHNIAL